MRESNSRSWSHNPAPNPFGQSRHQIWSWSSESNTRRRGTSSLHCHCARPANFWSWHAASNCGRALTMRLLFPLSYTSGERRVSAVVRELFARAQQRSVAEPSYKWSEQRESNSRHRVGGPRHQPLYHARFNKLWRSQRELNRGPQHAPILLLRVMGWLEPVPPERLSCILPLDSATTFKIP